MELIHSNFNIWKTNTVIPENTIEKMYALKELDEGNSRTNIGGWHSRTFTPYRDYYNGRYQWTTTLIEPIVEIVNKQWNDAKFSRAWFNLSGPGGTNKWHDHGQHSIVSVLYILTPEGGGNIEFRKDTEVFSYKPTAGDFLVFPGYLEHRVLENNAPTDRISLAVNFD